MPRKIQVALTAKQWEDVLRCVDFVHKQGACYGHLPSHKTNVQATNRGRTYENIRKAVDACGWCGAIAGFSDQGDGWPRCNACAGC